MRVLSADAEFIGFIKQRSSFSFFCGKELLDVFGPDGIKRFAVQANRCQLGPCPCAGCCEFHMSFFDMHGQQLTQQSDMVCESEAKVCNERHARYRLHFLQLVHAYDRALILAAIIFIDYSVILSRGGGGGGGGGDGGG
jgi:hypothetical protein